MRHTELNTDIVTWTRLLNRGGPGPSSVGPHTDTSASPMAIASQEATEGKSKHHHHHHAGRSDSPPSSPLSHSGGSTPKSPNTPSDLEKDEGPPINGELPPPIPINEDDLVPANRINDHPIIPPPREFLGSAEDIAARRRASEGSMIRSPPSSAGGVGHAPLSEGVNTPGSRYHQQQPPQQQQPAHHHTPHYYHHQQQQQHNSSNMAPLREVSGH